MINENIKKRIIDTLRPIHPDKIILFGSQCYGTPNENSDIDLFVIMDIPVNEVRKMRLRIKKILWLEFKDENIHFDILVDSKKRIYDRINIGDLFYEEIYNKGQIIYA